MGKAHSKAKSSPSSSCAQTTEFITTTLSDKASYQPPLTLIAPPPTSFKVIETTSHTHTFRGYSRTKRRGIGELITSSEFMAGGYKWALILYPEGKKEQDTGCISLYIRLESEQTDVRALFELVLVDQSGNEKHEIQTQFGREMELKPALMRHKGSQWGFSRYIKKKYLETSGFLRNDCLVVNCKIGVLGGHREREGAIGNFLGYPTLSMSDQNSFFMEGKNMGNSDSNESNLLQLCPAAKIILETGSPLQLKRGLISDGNRETFDRYLHAVDEIQRSIISGRISDYEGINAIQMAKKTLQLSFRGILESSIDVILDDGHSSTDSSSSVTNSYSYELQDIDQIECCDLSSEQVYFLRSITERLDKAGSLADCIEVYNVSRKSVVNTRFLSFGVGKWSTNGFRSLNWEESAVKIKVWIRAVQSFYRSIFPREKEYYENIFEGFAAATYDNCFLVIVEHVAIELSNFAEAVTSTTASYQKMWDILDMLHILLDITPHIKATFRSESSAAHIVQGTVRTIDRLKDLVRRILSDFENTILNAQSNAPILKGAIHSMTRYAMKYIDRIVHNKELLATIIISGPVKVEGISEDDDPFLEVGGRSPLGLHLIWIIISLKFNLEIKSRQCDDGSLGHLFLMNNLSYTVEEIRTSSELLEMIGEDYPTKLNEYVVQAVKTYVGLTWDKVINCLREEGLNHKFPFYNGIKRNALKERFKSFNSIFDEICRTQSDRVVQDYELLGHLHTFTLQKLIPSYELFLSQYRIHIESEKYPEKYIKYSTKDLERKVSELFSD